VDARFIVPAPNCIELRPYQYDAIQALISAAIPFGVHPIAAMPTGTGKSLVIARLAHSIHHWGNLRSRVLVLHHNSELIQQNEATLREKVGDPHLRTGIVSAKLDRKEWRADVVFASINSVYNQPLRFRGVMAIIIDECHLVSPKDATMFRALIEGIRQHTPAVRVIGLSATPYRLKMGHLTEEGGIFNHLAIDMTTVESFQHFLNNGWLSKLLPTKTIVAMNVDGLKTTAGDYQLADMDARYSADIEASTGALEEAVRLAAGRKKWLVFTTGVKHSELCAQLLNKLGVKASAVHSKLHKDEQAHRIRQFREGRLAALVNMNMLTTGFDVPDIDCIVVLRPSKSPGLWVQMLGRGTRPVYAPGHPTGTAEERVAAIAAGPKPDCLVLDFARNTERLGPIDDPVVPKPGKSRGAGVAPVKICHELLPESMVEDPKYPYCETYNHVKAPVCIRCGAPFIPKESKIEQRAGTLSLMISAGDDGGVAEQDKKPKKPDLAPKEYWLERVKSVSGEVSKKAPKFVITYTGHTGRKYQAHLYLGNGKRWPYRLWCLLTGTGHYPHTPGEAFDTFGATITPLAIKVSGRPGEAYFAEQGYFTEQQVDWQLRENNLKWRPAVEQVSRGELESKRGGVFDGEIWADHRSLAGLHQLRFLDGGD
jgi:DNA repair protein RadD